MHEIKFKFGKGTTCIFACRTYIARQKKKEQLPIEVSQIHLCWKQYQFLLQNVCNPDKTFHLNGNLVQFHQQCKPVQTWTPWYPPC